MLFAQIPTVALLMGERGLVSRVLAPKYGAFLTFAALSAGRGSAPGQPLVQDLLHKYSFRSLKRDTRVYGVIGNPISHSKSPVLHNAAFRACGEPAVYVPLLVDDLPSFLRAFATKDYAGFRYCTELSKTVVYCAVQNGSVLQNTVASSTKPSNGYTGPHNAVLYRTMYHVFCYMFSEVLRVLLS